MNTDDTLEALGPWPSVHQTYFISWPIERLKQNDLPPPFCCQRLI